MRGVAFAFLAIAVVGLWWPVAIAWPLVLLAAWMAIALFIRAGRLRRQPPEDGGDTSEAPPP